MSIIRVFPITSGHHEGQSFVQWTGHFSSDADAGMCSPETECATYFILTDPQGVIEDAKFKRREALADLANAVKNAK